MLGTVWRVMAMDLLKQCLSEVFLTSLAASVRPHLQELFVMSVDRVTVKPWVGVTLSMLVLHFT